ncbi:Rho GTPase-activating protein, partial [Schistosoma japonicum]
LNYSTALKNTDHHIKLTATTASPSVAHNTITTTATLIDNYHPAHLKSTINLPGKSSDPLNRRTLVNFPTNHTLNKTILSSNDCLTWHCRSDRVNRKATNHLTNNDQFTSIRIKPSVVPFNYKQEIITMPDNNNSNINDRKPVGELTLTERRTQQQQQQPYQPLTQPPQSQQQFISAYSEDKSNTLTVSFKENTSDKVKFIDTRRTTPRQLKQHQSKRGHSQTSTTVLPLTETNQKYSPSTNYSQLEKSKTTSGNYHSSIEKPTSVQQHTNSSDLATSLIRTASFHLKSTLSRLKRSNSGHSDKPIFTTTTTTTVPTTPTTIHTIDLPSVKTTDDTLLRHNSLSSENNKSIELVNDSNTNKNHLNKEFNNNNSNLSSSSSICTKWSTRLGPPPPPCTDICPKCTSIPTFYETDTVITTTGTRVMPSNIKNSKNDSALYSNITTTTTNGSNINSSGSVFHLLPRCERNNKISLLPDDCADFGGFGRINFRTGSFMGRYPNYSRTNHQLQQPQRGQYLQSGNINSSSIQQQQHQSQSLSDYRPLYLSVQPYATSSSSSNTTRSAPSPSLSSITSTHGMLSSPAEYHEHCQLKSQPQVTYRRSQNKSLNLKTSSSSSSVTMTGLTRSPRVNSIHNPQSLIMNNYHVSNPDEYSIPVQHHEMLLSKSSSPSPSCVSPHPELDPILERLLLDVTSIDEYRTALHSHGSVTPPTSTIRQLPIQRMHTSLGSSDPESISRSVEQITKRNITDEQQNVLHNIWDLNKQINDLIQMEFNYKQKQPTISKSQSPYGTLMSTTTTAIGSGSSAPKKHPFRWSSRTRSSSHKKILLTHTQSTVGQNIQQHHDHPYLINTKQDDSVIHLSSNSLQSTPIKSIRNTRNNKSMKNYIKNNKMIITPINCDPNQLDLMNATLIQLASITEKHCSINRSPFSWRFMKYRALLTSGDTNFLTNSLSTSPLSDKKTFSNVNSNEAYIPNQKSSELNSFLHHQTLQSPNCERIPQLSIHCISYTGPVFGQSLSSWQRRLGYPLPPAIIHMMDHLELNGTTAHGLFRRPGGKSRILALREEIERDLCWRKFDDWQPYDIADLLKQFFRELPECLFTSKLATVLVNVYICVPNSIQIDLLRWILISLPDENRIVLQKLLYLLNHLSRHSDVTEMTANNLAVCFAPSLYRLIKPSPLSNQGVSLSPRRLRRTTSGPDPKDLADQRAAQLSLSAMINLAPNLFQISSSLLSHSTLLTSLTPFAQDLETLIPNGDWPQWIQSSLSDLLRECSSSKSKGWNTINRDIMKYYNVDSNYNELMDNFEIHYKKMPNSTELKTTPNTLRLWRCSLYIPEINPRVILNRFVENRSSWDPEITEMTIVDQISDCVDLCELHLSNIYPQPQCHLHLLRGIQYTLEDGSCAMLSESICNSAFSNIHTTHSLSTTFSSINSTINVLGHVYEDHVYIRPDNNSQGCRVYLLSRVDLKGYGPDWYMNQWGHTLYRRLFHLRKSFEKSKSPILVYELDESISRPSPPPYTSMIN